MHWTPCI